MDETLKEEGMRDRTTRKAATRGNFYFGLGFVLLAGLLLVVGLGGLGITSLGYFSLSTALAMTAIAITVLGVISFVTLLSLRSTIGMLSRQESMLAEQSRKHAELDARMQAQLNTAQHVRDLIQDNEVATLSARQDAAFIASQRPRPTASHPVVVVPRPPSAPYSPFIGGQVHPVREVEGIGDHYGTLLDNIGIKDTEKLWFADASYVAGALKVAPATVESWQCMSELMAVSGIGKQYAELLVRADASSIAALCDEDAEKLLARIHLVEGNLGNRIQKNTIGAPIVESWIRAARRHHGVAATVAGSNGRME